MIDKDHTAALLAIELGADLRDLDLPAGSMGPKAEAACDFTTATGKPAMIGPLEDAENVIAGSVGTRILAPSNRAGGSAAD